MSAVWNFFKVSETNITTHLIPFRGTSTKFQHIIFSQEPEQGTQGGAHQAY